MNFYSFLQYIDKLCCKVYIVNVINAGFVIKILSQIMALCERNLNSFHKYFVIINFVYNKF